MKKTVWLLVVIALVAVGLLILSDFGRQQPEPTPTTSPAPDAPPSAVPEGSGGSESRDKPDVRAPTAVSLPPLDGSDDEVLESAAEVFGKDAVAGYIVPDDVVRKVVVTIDNLPREKVSMRVRAFRAVPGRFQVDGRGDEMALGAANFARYRPVVAIVNAADPTEIVGHFLRFYPLLQEAYEELGYPDMSFLDRVIAAIDDMLAAPEVDPGVRLIRPNVLYEFADPDLEARSAGQKMLMRMGGDNAAVVKNRLRQIRAELIRRTD
jgi:hypothetical protein